MMSSLFIGATGMKSHAEGMNVVSNNLANVNTVGFKKTMMLYHDLMSQTVPTRSNYMTNMSQVGAGATVGDTRKVFNQGGFEAGSAATDIGIEGIGFYGVQKNGVTHYTRAGNFRFNKEGELLDPVGWNLTGYKIGADGRLETAPSQIKLDLSAKGVGTMGSKATNNLTVALQLGDIKNEADPANPFFSMASKYDGTKNPPLMPGDRAYTQPIEFHDSTGAKRKASIYVNYAGEHDGQTAMEYLIALDPSEDASGLAGTQGAGLLMGGTFSFSSTGKIINMTAFTPPASGNPADMNGWTSAPVKDGHPVMKVSSTKGGSQSIAMDFGMTMTGTKPATAAAAAATPDSIYDKDMGAKLSPRATTKQGKSNSSMYMTDDGYPEGDIRNLTISSDGIVTAQYSNNQSQALYQIALYRFTSQDGLRREGQNHFSATQDCGNITAGKPGEENFGKLSSWSLETSNVDYGEEFVTLISTQRGFQMNSKVITTSDLMLQKALEVKR